MRLLARLNVFWLGAGGFLALFCANEIVANRVSRAPVWLGGTPVLVASGVGLLIGLSVMAFLGIEEPPEPDAEEPAAPVPDAPAGERASLAATSPSPAGADAEPSTDAADRAGDLVASGS